MIRTATIVVLAALLAAPAAQPRCGLADPSDCPTTNALVGDKPFRHALTLLGGPPRAPRRLADGSWLFAACRHHECTDKAAIVIAPDRMIVAAALLIPQMYVDDPDTSPADAYVLRIFVRDRAALARWAPMFRQAARRALADGYTPKGLPPYRLVRTDAFVAAPAKWHLEPPPPDLLAAQNEVGF